MGAVEWLLLAVLSVLWGGSFFLAEVAIAEFPPLTVVLARVGLAAAALNAIVLMSGQRMPGDPRRWGEFLVMGLLNNFVPFSLIVWGQTQITSGLAAILNTTTPLFAIVLMHFLTLDERMTAGRLAGVLFGFVGVIAMIGPSALEDFGLNLMAQSAVLAAALSYALAGIFGRRFERTPPVVTAAGQVTASTLIMLPAAFAVDRPWLLPVPSLETAGALLGLALFSTAAAYVIYFRILAASGATNLLLVTFLIPVTALLLGMAILDERLDPRAFIGMALIGLGLAAVDGRPLILLKTAFDAHRRLPPRAHRDAT